MRPEKTYHPAEHYVPPRSPLDVMNEFIALYEPGEDSVGFVMGLGRLYAKVPFLHLMQEYARFVQIARVEASEQPIQLDSTSHDADFLAGAIVAIHANTYGASDTLRKHVLLSNPAESLRLAPECEEKYRIIQDCISVMREWDEHGAQTSFENQSDDFKDKLLEMTIMIYNNVAHPNGSDMRFISGFMYSSQMIWRVAKGHGPPV